MPSKDIRIATWNANGIIQKQYDLQVFLDLGKIDICLVAETHLTKQSFIKFRGYHTYHTIHPSNAARGGSAIIIKNNIFHYEELKMELEENQVTAITINTGKEKITIAAIYCPPRHNQKKESYLNVLSQLGNKFIIGGDFNAKNTLWGSRLSTTKGKELHKAAAELGCCYQTTRKPTYWPADPGKIPDLLDFFITRKISSNYIIVEENFDLDSDHSPVILTLSENIIKKEHNPTLVNRKTDWEGFQEELSNYIQLNVPLKTTEQLNQEAEKFVTDIQQAAWKNTPETKRLTVGYNYPLEIRKLVAEKRKLRKKWQRTRAPDDKTRLNNATQKLRREIIEIKNESINKYLSELTDGKETDYSLWKVTKKLKRPCMHSAPIRSLDGSWAKTNQQKAEVFANHLERTFQPNDGQLVQELPQHEGEEINIDLVTPKEVAEEIRTNISSKKAPGYDLVTGEILKKLPRKAIVKLTYLINAAFRLKHVPDVWKVAEVIMIAKPGKPPNDISSYRPISLLPIVSKLFEKLLLKRLKPIIESKNLLPNHQFGFRNRHSTIDQVHRITDIIEKAYEEKKICSGVFLDVAQAFDKVWHEGLKNKLKSMLPKQYAKILKSYISDRIFRVKQEREYSNMRNINAGVPQGSVLGPILYLLYTCDIPDIQNVTIATFADDTAILAIGYDNVETAAKLQEACNRVTDWTKRWRVRINESKSAHVDFTYKQNEQVPVSINNAKIPHCNTAKYLGMNLDIRLRWKEHIKKKRKELDLKYKKMYFLIGRKSQLSVHNKLLLYKQILKPVWTYGAQLWGCAAKSNINKIQVFQNRVLRSIVDAPWYYRNDHLHRDLKIPTVREEITKFAKKHEGRLHSHGNTEVLQLLDNAGLKRRLKRIKPFELV